jgi:hypothetical protein
MHAVQPARPAVTHHERMRRETCRVHPRRFTARTHIACVVLCSCTAASCVQHCAAHASMRAVPFAPCVVPIIRQQGQKLRHHTPCAAVQRAVQARRSAPAAACGRAMGVSADEPAFPVLDRAPSFGKTGAHATHTRRSAGWLLPLRCRLPLRGVRAPHVVALRRGIAAAAWRARRTRRSSPPRCVALNPRARRRARRSPPPAPARPPPQ